ncbi:MAG: hypothetical protein KatS3mg105_1442 [Gemmatales bacterium]|nr:MAG: hypothetical protein KatS3mg105_1442 [Gemmatales bacterium]
MGSRSRVDRRGFLACLRRSNLLTEEEFGEVVKHLPNTDAVRELARHLVANGHLTRFQAEMLLAGRASGFILGQYRILDQIGRGGMGRVFKAVHQTMNRIVALKIVSSSLVKTERARKMFQREVRAAARLMHPNIVTAYDANQIGDRYYLVMEFVDGPNLEQLVREYGPLPVPVACEFIRQACLGLQAASELGMVHRDIKPANLLVQGTNTPNQRCIVKILDFGLARLHANVDDTGVYEGTIETHQNSVVGTPDYLSPEQAADLHKADIRSDLYSLGCTMYFLLTGQVPFPGQSSLDKLVQHSTATPVPIQVLRPEVSTEVAAIVNKLMAKAPEDRFQTPAELAEALAPFAENCAPFWKTESNSELSLSEPANLEDDNALAGTLPAHSSLTPLSNFGEPALTWPQKLFRGFVLTLFVVCLAAFVGAMLYLF